MLDIVEAVVPVLVDLAVKADLHSLIPVSYTHLDVYKRQVLLCEDGSHRLIRRAQTPRDYFATLDFLPCLKPLFED